MVSIPFVVNFGDNYAVISSWLGHFLLVISLFLFLRDLLGKKNWILISILLLLAATDPIMSFSSQKIWLDSLLIGLISFSIYLFWKAFLIEQKPSKIFLLVLSGIFLGGAITTKVPAVLLLPFYFFLAGLYIKQDKIINILKYALCFSVPVCLITMPWFFLTYSYYGKFLYAPGIPESLLNSNKYLQMVTSRPVYYYFKEIVLITPIILVPLVYTIKNIKKLSYLSISLWLAFFSSIIGYTLFAFVNKQAYGMRYLTLISFPMYLLIGICYCNEMKAFSKDQECRLMKSPIMLTLLFLMLIINSMTSIFFIFNYQYDDLFSLFELLI
jgi:4-amino-4-deoxy-L-arabinose transferase-like glycosyltransferase